MPDPISADPTPIDTEPTDYWYEVNRTSEAYITTLRAELDALRVENARQAAHISVQLQADHSECRAEILSLRAELAQAEKP